ncbi:discoidin domain-containing protein [Eubacterium sp.]
MKKLKLLAMSLAAIMTVSTVGMGDYTTVKGDDKTTCEVSTLSGNECVTYGKTVTSDMDTDYYSQKPLSGIVNGSTSDLWVANGTLTGNIYIDLGAYYTLSDFKIVFEDADNNAKGKPWKYTVEGSDDNSTWQMLWDMSTNTDDAKTLTGKNANENGYDSKPYKYIRIHITEVPGGVYTAISEFCAYGEKVCEVKSENVAVKNGVSAQGYYSNGNVNVGWGNTANRAIDGNRIDSYWGGETNQEVGQYLLIDFGENVRRKVSGLEIWFESRNYKNRDDAEAAGTNHYGNTWKYSVEGSNDNSSWSMLWDNSENNDWAKTQSSSVNNDGEYRYIKLTILDMPMHRESNAKVFPGIWEFEIYSPVYTVAEGDLTTEVAYGDTYTVNGDATYGYYYNEEMYKKGDKLTVKDNVNLEAVNTLNLSIANGAGIRTADPYGMRFQTTVTSDNYKAVNEQKAIKEGMLITTKDLYEKNGKVLEKESNYTKLDIANNGWYGENESAKTNTYCGSVVNIKEENFARGFIANAYVTITYKDGTTTTVYSDNMSDTRSVAQVAYNMTQSEGGKAELDRLGETIKAMIEGWATKYNANQAQ